MSTEQIQPTKPESTDSLLEDASTLLMFHSGTLASGNPSPVEVAKELERLKSPSPLTSTQKEEPPSHQSTESSSRQTPTVSYAQLPSNMSSPGPGVAALVEDNKDGDELQKRKALVAAAALAAAQNLPITVAYRSETEDKQQKYFDGDATDPVEPEEPIHQAVLAQSIDNQIKAEKADVATADDDDQNATDTQIEKNDATDVENQDDVETQDENDNNDTPNEPVKTRKPRKPKPSGTPKDYIVDPDAGTISCVCGFEEDDGFTIQCDHCNRWQHAVCMGIDSMDNVPDDYLCNICHPRKVDVKKAKALQSQRLDSLKRKRARSSTNADSGVETQTTSSKTPETKEERSNSRTQTTQKPKPKPPANPYGKNLEENDIVLPDSKEAYLTSYYTLSDYDYQDNQVYTFIQDLKQKNNPNFLELSKNAFKNLEFPSIKVKPYSEITNKKFNGITKLGLFTESSIQPSKIIGEYLGEINFKQRYIADSRNHYRIWGVEKPYSSFIPNTPLVIDARNSGTITRFIRRSCNPNCTLSVLKVGDSSLKFVIVAKTPIKPNTELTIGWNWDPHHAINGIINGSTLDQINDADKPSLVLSVESILTFVECACVSNNECALSKVKKASAHIYRATRKGNNTSGLKLLQREAKYVSIQERLLKQNISDLKEINSTVTTVPILTSTSDDSSTEAEVTIRPYIYNYLTKKRKIQQVDSSKMDYLPIPIPLLPEPTVIKSAGVSTIPVKPVKKLSFADYKKKRKPA